MNAFQRILWKEFRAQLHVWFALTFGVLLLQGVLISAMLLSEERVDNEVPQILLAITLVVGTCYAFASSAILFAGEQEDETAFFLRTFPVPKAALIGGKLTYTILSLLALLAVGLLSTLSLSAMYGTSRLPTLEDASSVAPSLIGGLAWGLFFSLLTERVIPALGWAILAEFVTVAFAGNFFGDVTRDIVYGSIVVIVFGVDGWLALRWTTGWNFSLTDVLPARAIATDIRSSRWLRLLQGWASRGIPARRATGVLLWKELRYVVPFAIAFTVLGVLLVVVAMAWDKGSPYHVPFFFLLPIACGLMAGGPEQRKQSFRFFTDRGISAYRVWAVKIGTWLIVGGCLTGVFMGLDELELWRHDDQRFTVDTLLTEIREGVRVPGSDGTTYEDRRLQDNFLLSTWLLLFTIGQWSGFWHRRSVVGAAVAIGLGFLAIGWQFLMIGGDIPLWLASWPLILSGLAATYTMSPHWLVEDRSWKTFRKRMAWVVLPILFVTFSARSHRIGSVPKTSLGIDWRSRTVPDYPSFWTQSPVLNHLLAGDDLSVRADNAISGREWNGSLGSAVFKVRSLSKELRLAKQLDVEWMAIRDLLHDIRAYALIVDSSTEWRDCLHQSMLIMAQVRDWTADPQQTEALLSQAIADLQPELKPIDGSAMITNRYKQWQRFLHGEPIYDSRIPGFRLSSPLRILSKISGETERARRLLDLITVRLLTGSNDGVRSEPVPLDQQTREDVLIHRLVSSTVLLPPDLRWFSFSDTGVEESLDQHFKAHLATSRGTLLVLKLQEFRLKNGHFPKSLNDLQLAYDESTDPFSEEPFLYRPEGFASSVELKGPTSMRMGPTDRPTIPAGQPVLLSVGPGHARIREPKSPDAPFEALTDIRLVRFNSLLGDTKNELNKDRVRFLILD